MTRADIWSCEIYAMTASQDFFSHEAGTDMKDPDFLEVVNAGIEGIRKLRNKLLIELDSTGVDDLADAHTLIALDLLSQAQQNLKLAKTHQIRVVARKAFLR
jgi:hypothetical protein